MSFVPGYDQDVFVSYAHIDDRPYFEPRAGEEPPLGWVGTLVRHLKNQLGQKIGRSDACKLWFDNQSLRGNHLLTEEIAVQLERSAAFVAIVSPGYLASAWCRDELNLFFRRSTPELARSVFLIEKAPLDPDEPSPPELRARRAYRFWFPDRNEQPRTLAVPVPHEDEREYYRQIEDLARDLADKLKAMRSSRTGLTGAGPSEGLRPLTGAPIHGAPVVLLAEVTDDLEFKRLEVQRFLEQHGLTVLPETSYPLGRAEFEAALDADLMRSAVFVQLLGPMPGKRPRDVPDGYGWLQLERALHRGRRVLQWRSPEVDPATVELPRHRELLERETVQATSLESFKQAICAAAIPPPPEPEPRRDTGEQPLVFINAEARHQPIAAEIRAAIGDRAAWAEPLFEGRAEEVREDLEQNLIDCDAMVMVYADNPGWARGQLRQFHKLAPRRTRPVRAIPIIDAPPVTKPELGISLPGMTVIDGRGGLGPETLAQLSASLKL
jgi:TIR domain